MGEADPVGENLCQDLLEADGDHGEVVAAEAQAAEAEDEAEDAGDEDAEGQGGHEVHAVIDGADGDTVGADAEERGLGDGDLAAIAEHDDDAGDGDRVGASLQHDVQRVALVGGEPGEADRGQRREAEEGEAARHGHAFSEMRSPNRPCGRTIRNISSMRKAKASL